MKTLSKTLSDHRGRPLVLCGLLSLLAAGCSRSSDSTSGGRPAVQTASASPANSSILLRGRVTSISADQLILKSDTGLVAVKLVQPFHLYNRVASDISHVRDSSFVGVTTVKQPDGSERATEIHLFPEELRGLGEGSRMMAPDTTAVAKRMTNGDVSASRMTNGNVSGDKGSTMVVTYAGGSQTVEVPPNTPVTELRIATKGLSVGDQVIVMATKAADGSLSADKALSTSR